MSHDDYSGVRSGGGWLGMSASVLFWIGLIGVLVMVFLFALWVYAATHFGP